jgi:hypothetical protein
MIERTKLIELVADKALGYLAYDDAHPNVGMGMFTGTAVDLAEQSVLEEAARWNSLAALALDFKDIRDDVIEVVKARRR